LQELYLFEEKNKKPCNGLNCFSELPIGQGVKELKQFLKKQNPATINYRALYNGLFFDSL